MSELLGLGGDKPVHRIGGSDLCDLSGITPGMLTTLGKRDIVVRLGHDAYDLEESARRYIASLRETASGRGGEEQVLDLTSERAQLAREQTDAQALKNAVLRGEYVPAGEFERAWADTRHAGHNRATLANRAILYENARLQKPERWSGKTRNQSFKGQEVPRKPHNTPRRPHSRPAAMVHCRA